MSRRIAPVVAVAISVAWFMGGCVSTQPGTGSGDQPKPAASDVTKGEHVELRLLTYTDATWKCLNITLPDQPPEQTIPEASESESGRPRFLEALAAAGAGALVGAIVDGIQAAIKAEAETHERQFRQSIYATDFWQALGQPRYAGFELKRVADGYDATNPAARLVVAFVYSPYDPRLVLLKPVYVDIRAAKAKVSSDDGGARRMNVKLNCIMVGSYVSEKGDLVQQSLADTTFTLNAVNLDKPVVRSATWIKKTGEIDAHWEGDLKDHVAGFFFSPRPSQDAIKSLSDELTRADTRIEGEKDADKKKALAGGRKTVVERLREAAKGGAFGLTLLVTETDASKAKDTLIQIADFVGAQRTPVVDQTKSAINPKK